MMWFRLQTQLNYHFFVVSDNILWDTRNILMTSLQVRHIFTSVWNNGLSLASNAAICVRASEQL